MPITKLTVCVNTFNRSVALCNEDLVTDDEYTLIEQAADEMELDTFISRLTLDENGINRVKNLVRKNATLNNLYKVFTVDFEKYYTNNV